VDSLTTGIAFLANHDVAVVFGTVYVVTIFGGNIAAFAALLVAFAAHLESWRIMAILGIVALGEVTGDCMWYSLAHFLRHTRIGNWIKNHIPGHARAEGALQKNGRKYLYLSKFAYGSAGFVSFFIGWTGGMPFKKFIKNSLMSVLIALPVLFLLAYGIFSGLSPLAAVSQFKHLERIVLVGIVAFLVLEYALAKVVRYVFGDNSRND